jgi:hypothetical protein
MPRNSAQMLAFLDKFISYLGMKMGGPNPAWANIPPARYGELNLARERFMDAFEIANKNRTTANIERRNAAQAAVTALVRAIVNQFLRFPPVTNADRIELGVPNHDTIRTDHTVVTENVAFDIELSVLRQLVVHFQIEGADHKAKPQGYDGAVIIWGVQETQPARPEELEHHTMASRTPFTLFFDEEERGKTAWVACCWQNERGITGAWSGYKSAVIP